MKTNTTLPGSSRGPHDLLGPNIGRGIEVMHSPVGRGSHERHDMTMTLQLLADRVSTRGTMHRNGRAGMSWNDNHRSPQLGGGCLLQSQGRAAPPSWRYDADTDHDIGWGFMVLLGDDEMTARSPRNQRRSSHDLDAVVVLRDEGSPGRGFKMRGRRGSGRKKHLEACRWRLSTDPNGLYDRRAPLAPCQHVPHPSSHSFYPYSRERHGTGLVGSWLPRRRMGLSSRARDDQRRRQSSPCT
ncbi:hypothetical protein DCS_07666 [Drechmeria coniospora]|uniref:Uncharacterized protein n=1 Tax=Drechmeria coniospora TaxID=98403 RepID=A0A151GF64_DRECN|nr:hypothetical protein DCS_07666 [Drechmeria coniospora]KYK55702.1 hypothetical protein DCS_07666 [Drechmeria coniospora]